MQGQESDTRAGYSSNIFSHGTLSESESDHCIVSDMSVDESDHCSGSECDMVEIIGDNGKSDDDNPSCMTDPLLMGQREKLYANTQGDRTLVNEPKLLRESERV